MEKMFKRTLLGAAVAAAAVSGTAQAAIDLNGEAVQLYGVVAANTRMGFGDNTDAFRVDIESRFGLKGSVEFDNFAPQLVWQIETGYADNASSGTDPWNKMHGLVGGRDTFVGLAFDGVGSLKWGRQLVAAYNYVDWPHSNPGLGDVFDWNNDISAGFEDRADDVLRFDSETWGGFNFQVSLSGMRSDVDNIAASLAASYTNTMFSVHAGHYMKNNATIAASGTVYKLDTATGEIVLDTADPNYKAAQTGDISYSIVGGSVFLGPVTLTAAYKMMDNDANNLEQNAASVTAQYVSGDWLYKIGYAMTDDEAGANTDDQAITGRIMYFLNPGAVLYTDVRSYDMNGDNDADDRTDWLVGVEYYF